MQAGVNKSIVEYVFACLIIKHMMGISCTQDINKC